MKKLPENLVIGISSACRLLDWTPGKFGGYYYKNLTPPHQIIDNRPVWDKQALLNWKPEKQKKGRKSG